MEVKIEWQLDDGYAGGSRPQKTVVDIDKEDYNEMTEHDFEEFIENKAAEDFENKITFFIDNWGSDKEEDDIVYKKIQWQVDDGYAGGSRPQETEVEFELDEYAEMSEDDLENHIYEQVEQEFQEKIHPAIINSEIIDNE